MNIEGLAGGAFALEGLDRRCRLGGGAFGSDVILGGGARSLLEFKFHLLDETGRAFGLGPIDLALELGDLEPLMRDQAPWPLPPSPRPSASDRAGSGQCHGAGPPS